MWKCNKNYLGVEDQTIVRRSTLFKKVDSFELNYKQKINTFREDEVFLLVNIELIWCELESCLLGVFPN